MKIINTGKVKIRVEKIGYIMPGEIKTVPDEIGRQICIKGSPFKKVRKLPRKKYYPIEVKKIKSQRAKVRRQKKK